MKNKSRRSSSQKRQYHNQRLHMYASGTDIGTDEIAGHTSNHAWKLNNRIVYEAFLEVKIN